MAPPPLCLPQCDTPENQRCRLAEAARVQSLYNFEKSAADQPGNHVKTVLWFGKPLMNTPGFGWWGTAWLHLVVMLIVAGVYSMYLEAVGKIIAWWNTTIRPHVSKATGWCRPRAPSEDPVLDRFGVLFTDAELSQLPFKGAMLTDEAFGAQRLGGTAPQFIRKVSSVADMPAYATISDADVADVVVGGVDVATLAAQGRLFVCDYHPAADGMMQQTMPTAITQLQARGWKAEPVAYFYVARGTGGKPDRLMPLAIQLNPNLTPGAVRNPIFTPRSKPELWLAAKFFVNHAEIILHIGTMHLGLSLIIGAPAFAMVSTMSSRHPICNMLQPTTGCSAGKVFLAGTPLLPIPPWKHVARKNAFTIWSADTLRPSNFFAQRGISRGDCAITDEMYPYRKYSMALWDELESFATEAVNAIYTSDDMLHNDPELQSWAAALVNPAIAKAEWLTVDRTGGVGRFTKKSQLIDVITTMFFMPALLGCDSLNYGWFAYTPATPMTFTLEPPTSHDAKLTMDEIFAALPAPASDEALQSKGNIFATFSIHKMCRLSSGGLRPHIVPKPSNFLGGSSAEVAADWFFNRLTALDDEMRVFNAELVSRGYQPYDALRPTFANSCNWA